jgi:hypothetical protein
MAIACSRLDRFLCAALEVKNGTSLFRCSQRQQAKAKRVHQTKPSGTTRSDGSVLITGGRFGLVPGGQLYDPGSGIFTPTANMIVSRGDHAAVLLNDGSVLISGGTASNSPTLDSAEIYHPAIVASPPALLSVVGGKGQGAILHRTSQQIISAANPAIAGEILEIYSTGLLSASVIPPEVSIGGRMAEVLFFGKARRFGGLYQINVRVPTGIAPSGSVPVRMTYLSRPSNEVTIPIQ